jgi:hypothetical protein
MAMAWRAASARAGRKDKVAAAASAPRITVRRDAVARISAHRSKEGAGKVRMRFAPTFARIYHRAAASAGLQFWRHSWLYCRREFGYHATGDVTLPPYFTRREPVNKAGRALKSRRHK